MVTGCGGLGRTRWSRRYNESVIMMVADMYEHSISNGDIWRAGDQLENATAVGGRLSETQ